MAIDWKKEWDLTKRIWLWYMKAGLLAIPFGILWATCDIKFHVHSKWALIAILAAAVATNYKIQGMPPNE
jgi:hypothetical protein